MRLRGFLFLMVLMIFAAITTKANAPLGLEAEVWPDFGPRGGSYAKTNMSTPASMAPSPLISEDYVLGIAYQDTLSILSSTNNCSDFFGGTDVSVEIFNELMGRVRKVYFAAPIGMKMSGEVTSVFNARTKARYRLFNNVAINSKGPFYRDRFSNKEPSISRIGSFEPNTQEARVLMFLHELGHLLKGPDGKWLLANDGNDVDLSRSNTQKVEDVCGDEIKGIARGKAGSKVETDFTRER